MLICFLGTPTKAKKHHATAMLICFLGTSTKAKIKTLSPVEFGNSKELPYFNVINNAGQPGQFDMDIK